MTSTILRIRNHPSLLLWTGGNEGHARKELYYAMRDSVIKLDGTRPFIPCSSGFARLPEGWDVSWPIINPRGCIAEGLIPGRIQRNITDWPIRATIGYSKTKPEYPLNRHMIFFPGSFPIWYGIKTLPFPLNHTWGYHDAASGNGKYELYYEDMVKRFGEPTSIKEFSDKMQLMKCHGLSGNIRGCRKQIE